MPRIRSIHPGLFTDEAFIQLSDAAQIFWVGLLTEADDQGVFEWKPSTLKLRLRGATTEPIEPLLDELAALDLIRQYTSGDRQYGAIRNFKRFQRPKKPNAVHPMPPEFRTYVSSGAVSSELPPPSSAASSELPPPSSEGISAKGGNGRAEEGGRREEERGTPPSLRYPRKNPPKSPARAGDFSNLKVMKGSGHEH